MNDNYLYLDSDIPELFELAKYLVARVKNAITITTTKPPLDRPYLYLDNYSLALRYQQQTLYINDFYNELLSRLKNLKSELLIQSLKLSGKSKAVILDVTAGLGRDGLLMALAGHQVTLLEYNPLLALVLIYASYTKIFPISMRVYYVNSIDYLTNLTSEYPEVVYFDPMFESNNNAKAKKAMQFIQILQANIPTNEQMTIELFDLALAKVAYKLVVKRDNKAAPIKANPIPDEVKQGKTIRYDIYQVNSGIKDI